MAIITPLSGIYTYFENGDAPNGNDFRNLIDTCIGTNSAQNFSTYTTVNTNSSTWGNIHPLTIQTAGTVQLTSLQEVVLCDLNSVDGDIVLTMPINAPIGKNITVKNINAGIFGHSLYVYPGSGVAIETQDNTVGTGLFATIDTTNATMTWVYDGSTWRAINKFGFE